MYLVEERINSAFLKDGGIHIRIAGVTNHLHWSCLLCSMHLYFPFPPLPVTTQRLIWGAYLSWSNVRSGLEDKEERIMEACQQCSSYYRSAHHQDTQQSCKVARGHHRLLVCHPPLSISPPYTYPMYYRTCTQKTLKHSNVLIARCTSNMVSTVSLGVTFYLQSIFQKTMSQFENTGG